MGLTQCSLCASSAVKRGEYRVAEPELHILNAVHSEHEGDGVEQVLAVNPRIGDVNQECLSYFATTLVACVTSSWHSGTEHVWVDHE